MTGSPLTGERWRGSLEVRRLLALALALVTVLGASPSASAATASSTAAASSGVAGKLVRYRGYQLTVPGDWPVYNLASNPSVCLRFDRHAVYLGAPGGEQRCPAHVAGRTEAIWVQPPAAQAAQGGNTGLGLPAAEARIATHGLIVTATWGRHPSIVQRALGVRALGVLGGGAASTTSRPAAEVRPAVVPPGAGIGGSPGATIGGAPGAGAVYTGLGFDSCSAPSAAVMSAWGSTRYHAAGIYIGGANMACSQTNLSASWVSEQSAAGWHLIPTYVGLQAPTNSCGCAGIDPHRAAAQGSAEASDAITQMAALGLGAGNPIYFDMEAYPPGGSNTSTVLTFLAAWTAQLHAHGYRSGVYSSASSGIIDLAARYGTSFTEPDEIWIADWNGQPTTSDPQYVPSGDWAAHQRLHQYEGGHDETHGGATINVDSNYLDGATAAPSTSAPQPAPAPLLTVTPGGDGSVHLSATWTGATGVAAWRMLGGASPGALAPLTAGIPNSGGQLALTLRSEFRYFAAQALGSAGQVLASTPAVPTPAHIAIYGRSVFAPAHGLGGLPVGCFTAGTCQIATTIAVGRTVLATTGPEFIPAAGGGIAYFVLTPAGRAMLTRRPGGSLSARVTARETVSGATATTTMNVIPFVTSGRGPHRSLSPSVNLQIVGTTDFVSRGGVGGILAGCFAAAPCHAVTTITSGSVTIARTGAESLGANGLGYLIFTLTPQGRSLLARAAGNQLGARVTVTDGNTTAGADIALVGFG